MVHSNRVYQLKHYYHKTYNANVLHSLAPLPHSVQRNRLLVMDDEHVVTLF